MKKLWIKKVNNFKEAEEFDRQYYSNMSALERLDQMQYLRESFLKFHKPKNYANRKRLRRFVKIIKQA